MGSQLEEGSKEEEESIELEEEEEESIQLEEEEEPIELEKEEEEDAMARERLECCVLFAIGWGRRRQVCGEKLVRVEIK